MPKLDIPNEIIENDSLDNIILAFLVARNEIMQTKERRVNKSYYKIKEIPSVVKLEKGAKVTECI